MPSTPEKLKSGNWRCIAYLGYDSDNKQRRKSFTAETAKKARQLAVQAEAEFDTTGIRPGEDAPSSDGMTLGEAISKYIALRSTVLSPATVRGYESIRRNRLGSIINKSVYALTNDDIQGAISLEAETQSPKTVRNVHGLLSAALNIYRPDLSVKVVLPQKRIEEIAIPSKEEIALLSEAAKDSGDHNLYLAILFGYQLGLRRSEICALTFGDLTQTAEGYIVRVSKAMVTAPKGEWVIKPPKTTAGYRSLPTTTAITAQLSVLDQRDKNAQIVPLNPDQISNRFRALQTMCGIGAYRFHDLRHYNASVMIAMGIPTLYITQRLGHQGDNMIKRVYGHLLQNKQEDVNSQLNAFFR